MKALPTPPTVFIEALQRLMEAASTFGIEAMRHYAVRHPEKHFDLVDRFNTGLAEASIAIELSPGPQIRLSLHEGIVEHVIFDSLGATQPTRGS